MTVTLDNFIYFFTAGTLLSVGFIFLFTSIKAAGNLTNRFFAATVLCCGIYYLFFGWAFPDADYTSNLVIIAFAFAGLYNCLLPWFFADYSGFKIPWILYAFSVLMFLSYILFLLYPSNESPYIFQYLFTPTQFLLFAYGLVGAIYMIRRNANMTSHLFLFLIVAGILASIVYWLNVFTQISIPVVYDVYPLAFVIIMGAQLIKEGLDKLKIESNLSATERENISLKELSKAKSNFFANISHEFRTPLTLILSPVKQLLSKTADKQDMKDLALIQKNAAKLHQMVNQILDLSKLESRQMEKNLQPGDLVKHISYLVSSFDSFAEMKQIDYTKQLEINQLYTDFNKEHIGHIVDNLLSNALKFTQEGGKVSLTLSMSEKNDLSIIVKDTGIGIPGDKIDHVFDRFFQADTSGKRKYEGTGIGLALVKELVQLYSGAIDIKSEEHWGTEVSVHLPINKTYLPEEIDLIIDSEAEVPAREFHKNIKESDGAKVPKENSVLIVEDNTDLLNHIKSLLAPDFNIWIAENGLEGKELALEHIPDLIVSDVMMPEMDGIEMTQQLKKDIRTSHIPIILLTAKSEKEHKLEGLKTGADDYVSKPFDFEELRLRINNTIKSRQILQDKLSGKNLVKPSSVNIPSTEERFLKKAISIVEQFIGDETFSVDILSKEIGMSRVQFHRKIKALTNRPTTYFIRSIRLERAKQLLEQGVGNITEIAYKVGFSSQSYFTRCFQEHFGKPPSAFQKKSFIS